MAIAQSASSQRRGLGRAASTADATRRLGALRADVGTATPRASRVKSSQVQVKSSQVKFEFNELHEIMNMIASAMQIMNMIVSAMGPFSAKASAETSIFVSAARKTRKTRPSV